MVLRVFPELLPNPVVFLLQLSAEGCRDVSMIVFVDPPAVSNGLQGPDPSLVGTQRPYVGGPQANVLRQKHERPAQSQLGVDAPEGITLEKTLDRGKRLVTAVVVVVVVVSTTGGGHNNGRCFAAPQALLSRRSSTTGSSCFERAAICAAPRSSTSSGP